MTEFDTADDPAYRDEIPPCWTEKALGLPVPYVFSESVRPWNWIELDWQDADRLWSLLADWVAYFNRRYGERPDRRIPPCWPEHGPIVEELTTLLFARWQAFESPHASIGGAQYWHSYTLPGFHTRLRTWLGDDLLTCQQGRHADRSDPPLETEEGWSRRIDVLRDRDVRRRHDNPASRWTNDLPNSIEVPLLEADQSAPTSPPHVARRSNPVREDR